MPASLCSAPRIRRVRRQDLEAIYAIERSVFEKPYPPAYLELLSMLTDHFLVATCSGQVAGYAVAVIVEENVCHVLSIAVAPGFQGHGIGSRLLRSLLRGCCSGGAATAMLEVNYVNYRAQRFYVRHGFFYLTMLPRYYGKDHAIIMLNPEPCTGRGEVSSFRRTG